MLQGSPGLSSALANTNMINFNYKFVLTRNSTDVPIFPTRGSIISFSLELTPPYSILDPKDYERLAPAEIYRYIEYHKWKFNFAWFSEIRKKLVFKTAAEFGFLGYYNEEIGYPPFERFYLGGDGLQVFQKLVVPRLDIRVHGSAPLSRSFPVCHGLKHSCTIFYVVADELRSWVCNLNLAVRVICENTL